MEKDLLVFSSDDEDVLPITRKSSLLAVSPGTSAVDLPIKRLAIIDALNVMHGCAGMMVLGRKRDDQRQRPTPNALGLFMLASQLLRAGFDFRAFVPTSYLNCEKEVDNYEFLKLLNKMGYVIEIVDGSHDDLILLELAKASGGFVISNDKFADHLNFPSLKDVIDKFIVRFSFRKSPENSNRGAKHYYGAEIILKPQGILSMYSIDKNDPTFGMVFCQRDYRQQHYAVDDISLMETAAEYIQLQVCAVFNIEPPTLPYFHPKEQTLPSDIDLFISWWLYYEQSPIRRS